MTRTVIVTGGSSGIGRAVAARFATAGRTGFDDAERDTVIVTGRRADALRETAAILGVRAVRCDATNTGEIDALVDSVGERVDVLVNMAGGNTDFIAKAGEGEGGGEGVLRATARAWQANLEANLLSAVLTTTALLPRMPAGGAVVNVSSIGAEHASTSYGAAKAAVAAWTAGLSAEIGPRGITANTISPGYIEDTGFFRDRMTAQRRDELIDATHDKRAGRPVDIAETVHFLASTAARHISGQTIHVNGGAFTTR